eukprot:26962_1
MYRCLVRNTNTLRRNSLSYKRKPYSFRKFTSISNNFKANLSFNARNTLNRNANLINNKISIPSTTSILLSHKRYNFNPNSTNPHKANDTIHTGSIGQYADSLFEEWQKDPNSVDKSWNEYFSKYYGYFSTGEFLQDTENNNNTNDYAAPIANAAPMRFGAKKQIRQKQYRVVKLQQDLFVMTVEAVYKELEEQKIWKIDETVRQQFDAESMYETVLKQDVAWRKWQWFVREQITNYLRENNMVISQSKSTAGNNRIRGNDDNKQEDDDEVTVFLKYYKLQKYDKKLRDVRLKDLNDLKLVDEDRVLSIAKEAQMQILHVKKFVIACNDLKSGKYPPKHIKESNKVDQWLEYYNLKKFSYVLKNNGLNKLDDINQLNENEIDSLADDCKMGVLHKKKFIDACQEFKQKYKSHKRSSSQPSLNKRKSEPCRIM